ncbi:uncharacterized protein (DUF1501 family) [Arenibacter algicola]|jgi:uncharacterized protein (DUF1501 family)|uniref:Uncharacterized protein (DUF1501 family) n=1 Tax=Arenibacter algicola TaxID=616991 RepID=A0A221UVS9_9FLAO|nr:MULTISPECIES: DUF1501 domain-containing protein [Arenibacter]ASO05288.1 hypothetical protein AREALGSMS7_01824 [Arenibacter algicola]MDX1759852.1 DUF1501 domain-containing protein [Arenibacter algicola]GBF21194.1 hypothetical protein C21_03377 [Arenibacter sp. NBRC 103722]|tara:strand:- start:30764 stop:32479 length:1716 start_codon:yes stop_codon:yes gene_type:complete
MCDTHHKSPHKGKDHDGHDLEHKTWSRRSFLQALGIAGSGSMMLGSNFLTASAPSPLTSAIAMAETDNILILIRLSGGNDGLSTIIPIEQYDIYANARPNIYLPESKILRLTDEFGVPTYMKSLEPMWGEGQFKAVHGVGYEGQSLSHFTGSDIFANTDLSTTGFSGRDTGWMGRHFEYLYPDYLSDFPGSRPEGPAAIQVGNYGSLVFEGEETNYAFVTNNIDQLEQIAETGLQYPINDELFDNCMYSDQIKFLRGVSNVTNEYAGTIHDAYMRGSNQIEYQDNGFARQLALLARLIKGNLGTKVYMISMGGFDTHGNQPLVHERLMTQLSIAVDNFYDDLAFTQQDDKVLSMTFSEFGRRIFENGSNGTDHGKAAPTLFFGSGLNGSAFVGDHPSLDEPNGRGNLEYTMDFRNLYATVLAEWLCVDIPLVEQHIMDGYKYTPVNLGFNCSGVDFPDIVYSDGQPTPPTPTDPTGENPNPELLDAIVHKPFYPTDSTPHIYLEMPFSGHVDIQLFNIMGQHLGTVYNEIMLEGSIEINVRERLSTYLASGKYIYRIQVQDKKLSKSIMVA